MMQEKLAAIEAAALKELESAAASADVEALRVRVLGKKGELTGLMRGMRELGPEERPAFGQMVNETRAKIESAMACKAQELAQAEKEARLAAEAIDVTLPGKSAPRGKLHPLTLVLRELEEIFTGMGFTVSEGPEVELDHYNFELLNIPKDHPARDMQDSFYFTENMLLRTHTSPMQARYMENHKPPIRIICPGKVYRVDEVDATHSPVFHQMEGLVVDKNIRMSDLYGVLDVFAKSLFGPETRTKFRPSYFPFTEPSAEVDVSCAVCGGKGCRLCKGTGWIEILGCGMVNPNVLAGCGIDPDEYSGFAFGFGLDRIAMIKYGISDIRLFLESDLRFLKQF